MVTKTVHLLRKWSRVLAQVNTLFLLIMVLYILTIVSKCWRYLERKWCLSIKSISRSLKSKWAAFPLCSLIWLTCCRRMSISSGWCMWMPNLLLIVSISLHITSTVRTRMKVELNGRTQWVFLLLQPSLSGWNTLGDDATLPCSNLRSASSSHDPIRSWCPNHCPLESRSDANRRPLIYNHIKSNTSSENRGKKR